ncbi:MAG: FAD-dependent oxidoreductase [Stappiaceae bacterium]
MHDNLLIVGAGQAAAQAIQSLRQGGFAGKIALCGDEEHLPYQRPPLSKKYLSGELSGDRLLLRPADFYDTTDVELIIGKSVEAIDVANKSVTLSGAEKREYDKLLLTMGTSARTIPLPGHDLEGVLTLRSIGNVDRIRPHMTKGSRLVIIGAGYIGLEVAAIARQLGLEVTVLEAQDRVLKRVVSPLMSSFFQDLHTQQGIDLRLSTQTAEISGQNRVEAVVLGDGTSIPCDLVLIAIGSRPNDDLAKEAGIDANDGILVDPSCETSQTDIFAAGDCTRFHSMRYGHSVRLESVQNAIDQAKAVAQTLCGGEPHYDPIPWFWSDQYDIKLQIAGLSQNYDEALTIGDPAGNSFYVAYLMDGNLIAVDSVCHPRSHMMARRVLGQPWSEGLLPSA